jgi:hypothetical protein
MSTDNLARVRADFIARMPAAVRAKPRLHRLDELMARDDEQAERARLDAQWAELMVAHG